MKQPHIHAALIKAWADDTSLKIQCRAPRSGRYDTQWVNHQEGEVPTWNEDLEYRIKPNTIKYRLYLDRYGAVRVQETPEDPLCWFVKYLTEWTEVEI